VGHLTALSAVKALSDMVEMQQQLWSNLLPPDTMRLISAGHRYYLQQHKPNPEPLINIA
jgi:hypothetical protein